MATITVFVPWIGKQMRHLSQCSENISIASHRQKNSNDLIVEKKQQQQQQKRWNTHTERERDEEEEEEKQ